MSILVGIGAIIVGFLVELYTFQLVRLFGHPEWAERYLGPGGSYTAWRIFGIVAIVSGYLLFRYPLFG